MENITIPLDQELGEDLDTKKAFVGILIKNSPKIILWVTFSLYWSYSYLRSVPISTLTSELGMFVFLFPWFFPPGWILMSYLGIREAFWKLLAKKYGWEYTSLRTVFNENTLLYQMGHSRIGSHVITGNYNNHPFHIFEYQYTTGAGKYKKISSFTVFEIEFTGTFPHLYLNYKNDWYSNTPGMFASLANISVPSEFEDRFKLYAPKEYEIETLEIFTPDIFALLLDLEWSHDMEFVDGKLIIYRNSKFTNFRDLDLEVNKIKHFIDVLSPLLNKLQLNTIGDISPLLGK